MEKLRQPSLLRIQILGGLWVLMLLVLLFSLLQTGVDVNILLASHFVRMTYLNALVLSALMAAYIVIQHNNWLRFPFAALTLFFGAFALLPYLVIRDLMHLRDQKPAPPR
ncbi:hypothetical protein [Deinococcus cellulosilyticus]|uniref:Uncharacterized protein n=1 Tax=Deinococcus cellulosilyticus (strain DSM 18568 / NBRC 106333 / KACC 11606 / 5516J-15) TaxID=1223518 RepID=A0A511N2G2_DEIC1|nr:hypothetical protein [Deinococcus cellulosilyticus]GEM47049.1 hypothetical protein DC3_26840 [Deinococcus cellulosilyticus NBRC 106333 = KACC 11606]